MRMPAHYVEGLPTAQLLSSDHRGGKGGDCFLDAIFVAAGERGVCAILIGDDPNDLARDLQNRFPQAHLIGGDA